MSFAIDVQELRERAAKRLATPATVATLLPVSGSKLAGVAGVAAEIPTSGGRPALAAVNGQALDPDRYCWPNGPAANTDELSVMEARLRRFANARIAIVDAELLVDQLLLRDRDKGDDRVSCAECTYGRSRTCPDGSPLPFAVLHRCHSASVGHD